MDQQIALHLRQPQIATSGLRVTLMSFVIEDVAADPGSGQPGFGLLIAQVELSLGAKIQTVEIASPVRLHAASPVVFGAHRISFVSSQAEYSKDPVIVVRVEGSTPGP